MCVYRATGLFERSSKEKAERTRGSQRQDGQRADSAEKGRFAGGTKLWGEAPAPTPHGPRLTPRGGSPSTAFFLAERRSDAGLFCRESLRARLFCFSLFLTAPHSFQDIGSATRGQAQGPSSESVDSSPLDCQGRLPNLILILTLP